jgi:hypothetical protein
MRDSKGHLNPPSCRWHDAHQNPEGIWAEIEQVVGGSPPHLASPPRGRGT